MDWLFLIEVLLSGLGTGALLALPGVAFVLIYKATKVVNLAIGETLMLGAYMYFAFTSGMGWPLWMAVPMVLLLGGGFGALIERVMIRPMLGSSAISVFMVTIGLGSVLVGATELFWGLEPHRLMTPIPDTPLFIGQAYVPRKTAAAFVVAVLVISVLLLVLRYWRGSLALRATAADPGAAYSCGVRVPRVYSMTWALASMVAAGSGILVGAVAGISPAMGIFGLSVLAVVIMGGLDSVLGVLLASLLVGFAESLAGAYLGGEYKLITTFALLLIMLLIRPHGLLGTAEIDRL
ncbi:MAG: branched-chain amino acid ABC transporter permease [Ottowia sp.]|uniref:branched-chain amino acid ABC transporter permease n=1 Tax=Ottowia sp. TaxID=1898956 RepID=UPI003C77ACCA